MERILILLTLIATFTLGLMGQVPEKAKVIGGAESAFEKAANAAVMPGPGCAVGVSLAGESVFEKAFGLADLEHNVPNTPQTIFESGSVAKQFTATALVLLQQDGKLNLDDPVKKYIPELPDYGAPLTIRHMLNHTAGLRDWGAVMALTGLGRGDRIISQAAAVDVILRQKHLDFKPGSEYSYSNSGYQLAAEIVERVSGKKFPDFVIERIFKPLGMTHSSLRDDFQRVVPGRAQAYDRRGANAPWMLDMPLMNVYGNGGILTTVGDWLKWNAALDSGALNPTLFQTLQTQGILNDGRKISYALGLEVGKYKGLRYASHGGSTAGYRTFLAHYPDQKVSVAVLCNGSSPGPGDLAAAIADAIFDLKSETPSAPDSTSALSNEELAKFAGIFRNEKTHFPVRITLENGVLRFNGQPMRPAGDGSFGVEGTRIKFDLDKNGKLVSAVGDNNGDVTRFMAEAEWKPTADDLKAFAGSWTSEEAQAAVAFVIDGSKAFIVNKPLFRLELKPLYKDHFSTAGYVVWFTRDRTGKIERMHVGTGRMRDMYFERARN